MTNQFKKISYQIMKGSRPNYKMIFYKNFSIIQSLFVYLKILKIYKKEGLKSALHLTDLIKKKKQSDEDKISYDDLLNFSMMLISFYRFFGRLFGETGNCLERSVGLYSALLYLGIKSELIIAKPKKRGSLDFMFHSWVEISRRPVNDFDDVRDHYYVLYTHEP
ncbi:lasso peptide biosynthesis protein [Paenibacillus sp. VCA1]|uniref:lasso peptide biosynthesis protein n=1 Tax=Paenibacillus sp. VCA1 TaxID=3039148 RepID=UPI002871F2DB|nr:lasso peptide biosynthesis protein [Paenibacillus sp. VCA1]MDR9853133.1 lasso peptide biosynthesis protein [Paenibacillus sp. VCA1]